jgi:hypothetical protein
MQVPAAKALTGAVSTLPGGGAVSRPEAQTEEPLNAIAHRAPPAPHGAPDLRLSEVEPLSPPLGNPRSNVEAGPNAVTGALPSQTVGGHSTLNAPAPGVASTADDRFMPVLEGIVASDPGRPRADGLLAQASPEPASQIAPAAPAPVPSAIPRADNVHDLGNESAQTDASALAGGAVPASSVGSAIERPAVSAMQEIDGPDTQDRQSPLVTGAPGSSDLAQGSPALDELREKVAPAGASGARAEHRDEVLLAAGGDESGNGVAAAREAAALSTSGFRSPAVPRTEEGKLSDAAPFRIAEESDAPQPEVQADTRPGIAHSGIIRENDRVAFARSARSGSGPDQASAPQMATISFASPAGGDRSVYTRDAGGAPAAIPLVDPGDGTVQLRLGDLIALLEDRMERPLFVWLSSAESASKYVTFDTLRASGIGVDYDPVRNHVILSVPDEGGR